MRNAEHAGLTTTKPEIPLEEILNAIADNLSDHASSYDWEDGEDEFDNEDDPELGKPSEDDEPGWVIGTISRTVENRMERIRQKAMKLDKMTQRGWGEAAD